MNNTPITVEDLTAALVSLGTTKDEVADSLRAARIKGDREECHSCPVAEWLKGRFNLPDRNIEPSVNSDWVSLEDPSLLEDISISSPVAVEEFVRAFDDRLYPDLDNNPDPDDEERE